MGPLGHFLVAPRTEFSTFRPKLQFQSLQMESFSQRMRFSDLFDKICGHFELKSLVTLNLKWKIAGCGRTVLELHLHFDVCLRGRNIFFWEPRPLFLFDGKIFTHKVVREKSFHIKCELFNLHDFIVYKAFLFFCSIQMLTRQFRTRFQMIKFSRTFFIHNHF